MSIGRSMCSIYECTNAGPFRNSPLNSRSRELSRDTAIYEACGVAADEVPQ